MKKEKEEESKEEAHRESQAQTLVRNKNWSNGDVIKHVVLTLYLQGRGKPQSPPG
jgi:hypothetical protein